MAAVHQGSELARPIARIRDEFPALADGRAALDGAAGTQLPTAVIDAVTTGLREAMANVHGPFPASQRSTETMDLARAAVADLVGGSSDGVVLGPNMTTLTFMMADTLSPAWGPGDEVVVTSLDHDANIRPWVLAARRAGVTVRWAEFDVDSGELPLSAFDGVIEERCRLVAVTAASNAIGTRPDVRAIADRAHEADALVYVDGVHATPHAPIDVAALGADFYACSSYKWFGPHTGAVIADPTLLAQLRPQKLAPASDEVPDRFERGTPAFEQLAGVAAAVDWIAGLTDATGTRRTRVLAAMAAVERYLDELAAAAREGLQAIDGVRVLGRAARRTSTISFTVDGISPADVAAALNDRGVNVWDGDNYAYELMHRFGLADSGGAVRASLVLYNDDADVRRLVDAVAHVAAAPG
ncbi:MAG TPA: cysteine desulfurase-like protein [Solirubrobacteraceae bacterium]|nr:cysteine desulfurase-like protein [Solirubrobacteraceae bacterium]